MVIRDKDLFVNPTDENVISPEDIALAEGEQGKEAPKEVTTEEMVTTEGADANAAVTPPATEEGSPEVKTEEGADAGTPPETKAEKSMSEILDEFEQLSESQTKKQEEIAKTGEELKKEAEEKGQDTELIDKMNAQILEMQTENKKLNYTVDYLKQQNEDLTKENLTYKFGRVDENGLMNLVDNDPAIKNIVAQTIKSQSGNPEDKEKLIEAYKTQLETLTGLNFSEFINSSKKTIEEENMASENDAAMNLDLGEGKESLFI